MSWDGLEREALLEAGLLVFAAGLATAIGTLVGARATGQAQRGSRHAEPPPSVGSIPASRHQHIQSAAPR
jgi:hypothetical protein